MSEEVKTNKDSRSREGLIWDEIESHYEGSEIGSAKLMALHDYKDLEWATQKHKHEPDNVKRIIMLSLVEERVSSRRSESKEYAEEYGFIVDKTNELRGLVGDSGEETSLHLAQSLEETYYNIVYPKTSDAGE